MQADRRVTAARDAYQAALRMYLRKSTPSNARKLAEARDFMQRITAQRRRLAGGFS